jgi:RNA polymerase sigma-70 factor, ECF subfamily
MPLLARLYNFAHWLTQDRSEAEDLVQETCMKALKGFASFHQGTNFRAWIYRILRNTFLTSRAGLRVATLSLDSEEDSPVEPVAPARKWAPLGCRAANACWWNGSRRTFE